MQLGKLHILLVHFPIALVVAAALADLLWIVCRRSFFRDAGFYCLLLAVVAAPLTAVTGDIRIESLFQEPLPEAAQLHETLGFTATGLIVAAAVLRLLARFLGAKKLFFAYGPAIALAMIAVALAGHSGGLLTHGQEYFSGLLGLGGR